MENSQRISPCGRVEPEANAGRKIQPLDWVNIYSVLIRKCKMPVGNNKAVQKLRFCTNIVIIRPNYFEENKEKKGGKILLVPNQKFLAKWNSKNKAYYTSLGYNFTKMGDSFYVKETDLTKGSKTIVKVKCDYCGEIIEKKYQTYIKQHDEELGDCCAKCQPLKAKEIYRKKYNVDNPFQSKEFKEKSKKTCLKKYGVERACQSQKVKEKIKETCIEKYGATNFTSSTQGREKVKESLLEKYGTTNVMKIDGVKDKIKQTNLSRYGVEYPLQNEKIKKARTQTYLNKYGVTSPSKLQEVKDKIIQTNLHRYGYEHTLQVPEIREKGMATLLKNGLVPTSSQQLEVYDILKSMYNNCDLNKPCGRCFLDCVIVENGIKIDIEYDGIYWHQDEQKDRKRDEFVKSQGYKVLRIRGKREVPSSEQLKEAIDYLLNSTHTFKEIILV